jgi:hypothetical protein
MIRPALVQVYCFAPFMNFDAGPASVSVRVRLVLPYTHI